MKNIHVIYCVVIFMLVGYIGSKQTSFVNSIDQQEELLDSLTTELDSLKIKQTIYNWVETNDNYHFFHSLGFQKYHSLIPHCKLVLGNSSSGIIEVPYFKIPTINIGDRQSGRIRHESIIDVGYSTESIKSGIEKALSKTFCKQLSSMNYKFGDGHAAERIINKLATLKIDQNLLRKKLDFSL